MYLILSVYRLAIFDYIYYTGCKRKTWKKKIMLYLLNNKNCEN